MQKKAERRYIIHPDLYNSIGEKELLSPSLLESYNDGLADLSVQKPLSASRQFSHALEQLTISLAVATLSRAVANILGNEDGGDAGLSSALLDAYKVIELTPTSADGYLCAGDVHLALGQPAEALAVYRRGMSHTVPGHPRLATLTRSLQNLDETVVQPQNNNLLARLGPWIAGELFSNLPLHDRVHCAATCTAWRNFIYGECKELWPHVLITESIDEAHIDAFLAWIVKMTQSAEIKEFAIQFKWGKHEKTSKVLDTFVTHIKCKQLQSFFVRNCNIDAVRSITRILRMNHATLRQLVLKDVAQCQLHFIFTILRLCPHLEDLDFDIYDIGETEIHHHHQHHPDYNNPRPTNAIGNWEPEAGGPLRLTRLKVTGRLIRRAAEQGQLVYSKVPIVISILRFCSRLHRFWLVDEEEGLLSHLSDICSTLTTYCPELRSVYLNGMPWQRQYSHDHVLSFGSLRRAGDNGYQQGWRPHLDRLLENLAHQLKKVDIDGIHSGHGLAAVEKLVAKGTPQLVHLTLTSYQTDIPRLPVVIHPLLQSSTRIKSIYLGGLSADHLILDAIPATVSSLHLRIDPNAEEALYRCLNRLSPSLETLQLQWRDWQVRAVEVDDRLLLSAVAKLDHLADLGLDNALNGAANDQMEPFFKGLFDRPAPCRIRSLSLNFGTISSDVVVQLLRLPRIKTLNIHLINCRLDNVDSLLHNNLHLIVTDQIDLRISGEGVATYKVTPTTCIRCP